MKRVILICLAAILSFCSCGANFEYAREDFFTMSTYATLVADGAEKSDIDMVKETLLAIEKKFSATNENSLVYRYNNGKRDILDDECMYVINAANKVACDTDGAFDYTLGSLVRLWNINGENPSVPDKNALDEALLHTGYKKVVIDSGVSLEDEGIMLDFGGIVKGYAGDAAVVRLKKAGISDCMLSIGGNITMLGTSQSNKIKGQTGWTVAITNPYDKQNVLGYITTTDCTVSVSGDYERYFVQNGEVYHHIFDSKTGYPAQTDLRSVAVICDDGIYADALSTALFVMGKDAALDFYAKGLYDFEAVFCTKDGKVLTTDGIKDLFIPEKTAAYINGKNIEFTK